MEFDSAVVAPQFHSGSHPDIDDPRWENGFLRSLRPYDGLDHEAWDHVMECVDAVAEHLKTSPVLNRSVINSLWAICHYSRAWGLHPGGMLRRNNLIKEHELVTLEEWIETLSERIAFMLDGMDGE